MSFAPLALVNAGLFTVQLYVNYAMSRSIGPMSRKHETLITPAPYAFSIWGLIYTLLTILVVVDVFYPSISLFAGSPKPGMLRLIFAASCVGNMTWIVLFSNEQIHLSTFVITLLWGTLFTLYVYMISDRNKHELSYARYFCCELGLTIYFAWTCAATLISFAVSMQQIADDYLSLTVYIILLSVLGVATISAVVFNNDVAFGLVAMWALIAVSVKSFPWERAAIERMHENIRVCAAQNAAMVAAFIAITLLVRLLARFSNNYEALDRAPPVVNGKSDTARIYYGST
ncbi:hypothetical protein Poli38472_006805 [Pythium oligandrum]|uniref:Uncharacterized protein n=1 Tax=Pythium oligandrum TaxID=41045 RepID=A0A8K1C5M6_PYTOL|nr:hypothetical protein Poli38472_006805 [Pythium oligandrum]|eukprot:TMW56795.1 hypothetical protein Poli38472_006805 [Pythium oligandrum]